MAATIHDLASYRRAAKPIPVADPVALIGTTMTAAVTLTAALWIVGFAVVLGGLRPPPVHVHGRDM